MLTFCKVSRIWCIKLVFPKNDNYLDLKLLSECALTKDYINKPIKFVSICLLKERNFQ